MPVYGCAWTHAGTLVAWDTDRDRGMRGPSTGGPPYHETQPRRFRSECWAALDRNLWTQPAAAELSGATAAAGSSALRGAAPLLPPWLGAFRPGAVRSTSVGAGLGVRERVTGSGESGGREGSGGGAVMSGDEGQSRAGSCGSIGSAAGTAGAQAVAGALVPPELRDVYRIDQ